MQAFPQRPLRLSDGSPLFETEIRGVDMLRRTADPARLSA